MAQTWEGYYQGLSAAPQPPEQLEPPPGISWLNRAKGAGSALLYAAGLPGQEINTRLGQAMGDYFGSPSTAPFFEQATAAFVPGGKQERTWQDVAVGTLGEWPALSGEPATRAAMKPLTRPIVGSLAGMLVDPVAHGALGVLSKLGPAGGAAHQLFTALFTGSMGVGGYEAGKKALQEISANGFTPEAVEAGVQSLVDLGFAGLGTKGFAKGMAARSKPAVQQATVNARAEQMQPPPGTLKMADVSRLSPEADASLKEMFDLTLGHANNLLIQELQNRAPGGPPPQLLQEVVFADRAQDGTPIPGNAASYQGKLYVTSQGRAETLQAADAAGVAQRIQHLVAHEAYHPVTEGRPTTSFDPMTGEPLEGVTPNAPYGHAEGKIFDDRLADTEHQLWEAEIRKSLGETQALKAQAGGFQEEGRFTAALQEPSALSPTAGTYHPELLELASGLRDVMGEPGPRPYVPYEATTAFAGPGTLPEPAAAAGARRMTPPPGAGPIERKTAEVAAAPTSFLDKIKELLGRSRPASAALRGEKVMAPPSAGEKAYRRILDFTGGRGTTRGAAVYKGQEATNALGFIREKLEARKARGESTASAAVAAELGLEPGHLLRVHQGLLNEKRSFVENKQPVPGYITKGLDDLAAIRRMSGRLVGAGPRFERGLPENLFPGTARRAALAREKGPGTMSPEELRQLDRQQQMDASVAKAKELGKALTQAQQNMGKFTSGSQEWLDSAREARAVLDQLRENQQWLPKSQAQAIKAQDLSLTDKLKALRERMTKKPPQAAGAGRREEEVSMEELEESKTHPEMIPDIARRLGMTVSQFNKARFENWRADLHRQAEEAQKDYEDFKLKYPELHPKAAGAGRYVPTLEQMKEQQKEGRVVSTYPREIEERTALRLAKELGLRKPEAPKPTPKTALEISKTKPKETKPTTSRIKPVPMVGTPSEVKAFGATLRERIQSQLVKLREKEEPRRAKALYTGEEVLAEKPGPRYVSAEEKTELAKPHEPITDKAIEVNVRPGELGDALKEKLPEKEFKLKPEYTEEEKVALKGKMKVAPRVVGQLKATERLKALLFGTKPGERLAAVNAQDATAADKLGDLIVERLSTGKLHLDLKDLKKFGFTERTLPRVQSALVATAREVGKGNLGAFDAAETFAEKVQGIVQETFGKVRGEKPLAAGPEVDRLAKRLEEGLRTPAVKGFHLRDVPVKVPWGSRTATLETYREWLGNDASTEPIQEILQGKSQMLEAAAKALGKEKLPEAFGKFSAGSIQTAGKRQLYSWVETVMNYERDILEKMGSAVHHYDQLGNKARADRVEAFVKKFSENSLTSRLRTGADAWASHATEFRPERNRLGTERISQREALTKRRVRLGTQLEYPAFQESGGKVGTSSIPDLLDLEGPKRVFPKELSTKRGPETEEVFWEQNLEDPELKGAIKSTWEDTVAKLAQSKKEPSIKGSKVGESKYTGVTRRDRVERGALSYETLQTPRISETPPRKAAPAAEPEGLSPTSRAFMAGKHIPGTLGDILKAVDTWVERGHIQASEKDAALQVLRARQKGQQEWAGRGVMKAPPKAAGALRPQLEKHEEKHKAYWRKVPESSKKSWEKVRTWGSWLNVTRPIKTAIDVSNPLRNTWQLSSDQITRDVGKLFRKSRIPDNATFHKNVWDSIKAFSEGQHKELDKELKADPYFKLGDKLGINFVREGHTQQEGWIGKDKLDKAVEKAKKYVPGLAQAKWLVDGSERAYVYYQNKAMRDAFRYGLRYFQALAGRAPKKYAITPEGIKDLIAHINNAGSRVKVTSDPKIAEGIGYLLYSAQMNTSRIKMLANLGTGFKNLATPLSQHYARMQTLRAISGAAALTGLVYSLGKLTGEDPEVEADPRSTDWGKVKFGPDITFDGWGGNQQFLRVFAQVGTRQQKERSTGLIKPRTVKDTLFKFLQSKASPGAQAVWGALETRTTSGKPMDFVKDPSGAAAQLIADMITPMSVQDTVQLWKEKPQLSWLIPLMMLGEGLSSGQGAKESWLAEKPGLREKDVAVMKELRERGVTGPRLGGKVTIPGKDVYGRRKYYNLSPTEVEKFEKEYMPLVTELLNDYITSAAYQKLSEDKQRKHLFKYIHQLNIKYGAATRLKKEYSLRLMEGKVKPSNIVPEGEEE